MFRVTDAQGEKNFTCPKLYKKVKVIIGSENYPMLLMQTILRAKPQSFLVENIYAQMFTRQDTDSALFLPPIPDELLI